MRERERKAQIDEGMSLANSVEELRNLRVGEEAALISWRDSAVISAREELSELATEKRALLSDIEDARSLRASLLEPLDAEWARVRSEQSRIEGERDEYDSVIEKVEAKSAENGRRASELDVRESDFLQKETELDNLLSATTRLKEDARTEYEASVSLREDAERIRQAARSEIGLLVATYENGIAVNEMDAKRLIEREEELITRTALIADREETLDRELARGKK